MEHNVEIAYDGADMSKPEAIGRMIEGATAHFGRVDILVNNAGIQHVAPIEEFPLAKWDAILAINLSAASTLYGDCEPPPSRGRWAIRQFGLRR